MFQKGFSGLIYKLSDWFLKITYLNILWILFSLSGFIVLGIFPATIALFSVIHLLLTTEDEIPIFKTFWQHFKREFVKGNVSAWSITIIIVVMAGNIHFFKTTENHLFHFLYYPSIALTVIFVMSLLYFFPVYVQYNMNTFQNLKNSLLVMISNPLNTLTMVSSVFVIGFVSLMITAILPFVSVSLTALFIMMAALQSFKRIEEKQSFYRIITKNDNPDS
ncbi:YesL family protein [Salimicrobium halophilum]|uniref:Uncharacterized membrane protein YesL n=1 Tax=Salimicrobium halophilum TaxID=86666 RepID=A0A1G8T8W0_9BACI|nr:YesL family protein [Salimicrobium halophilum]SDJ37415.1 Uncharacterized membrane protein YesL [Salimicrobium halophilum]